ncbi:hypothetical protein SAMN05444678_11695 [Sphingomonas sp. YR710]|uniref:hypothetical protein n=1 Tax=Sphingomonas sp. YR710 TaxID=1882773 RepID=UPI00088E454E|nr:hypothetical protein [Sphingomonas sp. YR710]SDD58856.1 hypothetical protein SAMN05444678_11695 [Sphingomonas sp. YR710]
MPNSAVNATDGSRYVIAFSSVLAGGPATITNGRSYTGATVIVGRGLVDYTDLKAAGWIVIADHTGTTAQRPVDLEQGGALPPGFRYLDTTISKLVFWTGRAWIDATGASA